MNYNLNFDLNNIIYEQNNNILYDIIKQLEKIINDLNSQTKIDMIIKQIKNIIIIMNKVISENKKNTEQLRKDINLLNSNMISYFQKIYNVGKKVYEGGKYVREFKNELRDGKRTFYYNENNKYERKRYEGEWRNDKI